MLYKQMIGRFRSLKKQSYLDSIGRFKGNYAFLGVGEHSMNNLYPCLQHLNVNLKYIYSHTLTNAEIMSRRFAGSQATSDYNQILADKSIDGLFICLRPVDQFKVLKLALNNGIKIFVEKPPCQTPEELEELIAATGNKLCFPGLQRRYATINKLMAKNNLTDSSETYRYLFQTGMYPDGDIETELFIHPVDYILNLFGDYERLQVQSNRKSGGVTYHIQVEHKSGVKGQIELSSQYSWNKVSEMLEINTAKRIVTAGYPYELSTIDKSTFLNIPMEKIMKGPAIKRIYLDALNFVPGLENNTLVLQGFYDEILSFLSMCETGPVDKNKTIESLKPVYRFLTELKAS
jgi:virulence factor